MNPTMILPAFLRVMRYYLFTAKLPQQVVHETLDVAHPYGVLRVHRVRESFGEADLVVQQSVGQPREESHRSVVPSQVVVKGHFLGKSSLPAHIDGLRGGTCDHPVRGHRVALVIQKQPPSHVERPLKSLIAALAIVHAKPSNKLTVRG